jgi:hypothetical protein
MNTQSNTQAQSEQETQALKIDFKHRLSVSFTADSRGLCDSVDLMADRATSILIMLTCQFDNPEGRLSDALIVGVIDAVIQEIEDIKATVDAYHSAECSKSQA